MCSLHIFHAFLWFPPTVKHNTSEINYSKLPVVNVCVCVKGMQLKNNNLTFNQELTMCFTIFCTTVNVKIYG